MPTRRQFLAAGAGSALALAGCTAPRATTEFDPLANTRLDEFAVTQFRGGLRNRGYVDATVPDAVRVDWRMPVNRGEHTAAKSTPVAVDGDVVIAGDTGTVRRVTPDGEVRWSASVEPTTRGVHGTPAVANGTVYVGAYDGALYAFDLATGDREWRVDIGDAIGSSPVYYNGVCYIAVEYSPPSGSVAAVDAATGAVRWIDHWPSNHPHSTVALDREAGRLVVGDNDGRCYAWSFPEMERRWTVESDGPIKGPIAIQDGLAIFGSWDSTVYAVRVDDGEVAWTFDARDDVMSAPAITPGGEVYVGDHAGTLYALSGETGEERWRFDTDGFVIGGVVATPERVLFGSHDTRFYALDADAGDEVWTTDGRGRATSAALITDDAVYYADRAAGDDPGFLYRLVPA